MYLINAFQANSQSLGELHRWIDGLAVDTDIISKLKLRLLLNESFVNSCEVAKNEEGKIVVIIECYKNRNEIVIIITDEGPGFEIEGKPGDFSSEVIGKSFLIVEHQDISLFVIPESKNKITFRSEKNRHVGNIIRDRRRGLLSMLEIVDKLDYYYSEDSSNYLQMLLKN